MGDGRVSKETQWPGIRGAKRVNARIPVAIEWEENENTFRKEGNTLDVSYYGCLVVVPERLALGQRVRLTNLISKQSSEAVIAWEGEERSEVWELGLALVDPAPDFWGVEI